MGMTQCEAGLHWYDSDKHSVCPYCRIQESAGVGGGSGDHGRDDGDMDTETLSMDSETQTIGMDDLLMPSKVEPDQYVTAHRHHLDPEGVTLGIFKKRTQFSPVVGWLVCTDGAERGKDYRLRPGINTVGRGDDNDVVIKGDDTISRTEHVHLEYDSEENSFYLLRKKNPEVRLDGKKIREPKLLTGAEIIQLGETVFRFVPFCSESFKWTIEE